MREISSEWCARVMSRTSRVSGALRDALLVLPDVRGCEVGPLTSVTGGPREAAGGSGLNGRIRTAWSTFQKHLHGRWCICFISPIFDGIFKNISGIYKNSVSYLYICSLGICALAQRLGCRGCYMMCL